MNDIIRGRTNPNIRHLIKGVLLAELLNKHLREKIEKHRTKQLEEIYDIEVVSDDEKTPLKKN